jgi:hypothetical protein
MDSWSEILVMDSWSLPDDMKVESMDLEYRFDDEEYWYGPAAGSSQPAIVELLTEKGMDRRASVILKYCDDSTIEWRPYSRLSNIPERSAFERVLVQSVAEALDRRG